MATGVSKGQRYVWNRDAAGGTVYVEVCRVARDGTWADILCTVLPHDRDHGTWTRRQPLPLPESFVAESA
jgi:hypothetical protein